MKKLLIRLFVVLSIIILLILALWAYLGWFSKLNVEEKEMWPYTVVYAEHIGDYKKVWPIMEDIYQSLKDLDVEQSFWIWLYYDDPATTPKEELKSKVWSVINPDDLQKFFDSWLEYDVMKIEKWEKIVVQFPYKNMLSYILWPIKVYPFLRNYIIEKWYDINMVAIELYDMENKLIYFVVEK